MVSLSNVNLNFAGLRGIFRVQQARRDSYVIEDLRRMSF